MSTNILPLLEKDFGFSQMSLCATKSAGGTYIRPSKNYDNVYYYLEYIRYKEGTRQFDLHIAPLHYPNGGYENIYESYTINICKTADKSDRKFSSNAYKKIANLLRSNINIELAVFQEMKQSSMVAMRPGIASSNPDVIRKVRELVEYIVHQEGWLNLKKTHHFESIEISIFEDIVNKYSDCITNASDNSMMSYMCSMFLYTYVWSRKHIT